MQSLDRNRRIASWAILIAAGAIIWILEEFIPRPLPWIKPGLANIFTLVAIVIISPSDGIIVSMGRVILAGLIIGRLGSPNFILSLAGAFFSSISMAILWRIRSPFSIYGLSVIGSLTHVIAQLGIAFFLINFPGPIWLLISTVLLPSIFTGILIGFLTSRLLILLQNSRIHLPE